MSIKWTSKARGDLARLYTFLAKAAPKAAARTVSSLVSAPTRLLTHPRLGEILAEFEPREVRRILIGPYELRYEIVKGMIYVLRIWNTREDRRQGGRAQ